MSDANLTPEEAALLAKLLAKSGLVAAQPSLPKKEERDDGVEVTNLTDVQKPVVDRGKELKGKEVHIACRVQGAPGGGDRKCEGTTAQIIRSANKSMNLGAGELAGGGRVTTYRCLTCQGTWVIST